MPGAGERFASLILPDDRVASAEYPSTMLRMVPLPRKSGGGISRRSGRVGRVAHGIAFFLELGEGFGRVAFAGPGPAGRDPHTVAKLRPAFLAATGIVAKSQCIEALVEHDRGILE